MAAMAIGDVITDKQTWHSTVVMDTMVRSRIWNSGAVMPDAILAKEMSTGATVGEAPWWNDLDNNEPEIPIGDPSQLGTVHGITQDKSQVYLHKYQKTWGWDRLAKESATGNPDEAYRVVTARASDYWARQWDAKSHAVIEGVMGASLLAAGAGFKTPANTFDLVADNTGTLFSLAMLNDTHAQHFGDVANELQGMILTSPEGAAHMKNDDINAAREKVTRTLVDGTEINATEFHYNGFKVVTSNRLRPVSGVTHPFYVVAPGLLGYAEVQPDLPVEEDSSPLADKGRGQHTLTMRRDIVLTMRGCSYTKSSQASPFGATDAELALPANWRIDVPEREQLPIFKLLADIG